MKNEIARAIYEASKNKEEVTLNIRLQKSGRFAGVSGTVEELKVSRDGFPYVVVKKDVGFQSVRLNNVLSVSKRGKVVK